jgi:gas vesicle protein
MQGRAHGIARFEAIFFHIECGTRENLPPLPGSTVAFETPAISLGLISISSSLNVKELVMKSFVFGLGVGLGLGVLFAPGRGEDTRRDLSERLNGVAEDAQRKTRKVVQHLRDRLNDESDSDDSAELPPKKNQARETAEPATSSTERTS